MKAIITRLDCAFCRETPAWCLVISWWMIVSLFIILY